MMIVSQGTQHTERKADMKVALEKEYRKYYTLEDLERAKAVISYEKEDEETVKGWAEYAAREALNGTNDFLREVIKADAHTARNCRAWNAYGDGTQDMDVWIDFTAETADGFLKGGAYLSDIWQTGAVEYKHHMYFRHFVEATA